MASEVLATVQLFVYMNVHTTNQYMYVCTCSLVGDSECSCRAGATGTAGTGFRGGGGGIKKGVTVLKTWPRG